MNSESLPVAPSRVSLAEGWTVHRTERVASTNSAVSFFPPWHALQAAEQTAGRGRTGRTWVSNTGGLWLSAVVPCPGDRSRWAILPLAAGWALLMALKELNAPALHLRWPNDIMAGHRKLAGLLVERFNDQTAVIGVGLNVTNSPGSIDPTLVHTSIRLADLTAEWPLEHVAKLVLRSLRHAHALICQDQFSVILEDLNRHWSVPRLVSITLNGHVQPFTGLFTGVDLQGRLRVTTDYGSYSYDASQVTLLRELE
ncbi:MAG: biotin--[acetyl-CoA-carboxylase] ligase [Opitutus sp.]